ncbi:hypothetical protein J1N35_044029 [Gossypium stocksii]|uniref:Uncharacterized protein n=1 Tax=Gossypium stocksii TaxID=47602 RepID=A0A9D3U8Q1_9ROSI|nr:hypothetical protein J1N35_044029 [Gossypium stocksii]
MVVSSEVETNSGRMESRNKRRTDHAGTFTMMATIPTSPTTSSQIVTYESSSVTTHDNSPPPYISLLVVPLVEELPTKNNEVAKRKICADDSFGSSQKSVLLTLNSSLQAFLGKASVISLSLKEKIIGIEATQRKIEGNLKSTRER